LKCRNGSLCVLRSTHFSVVPSSQSTFRQPLKKIPDNIITISAVCAYLTTAAYAYLRLESVSRAHVFQTPENFELRIRRVAVRVRCLIAFVSHLTVASTHFLSCKYSVFFLDDTSPIADGFKKKLKIGDDFSII
jgi:hypothetical protein